MDDHVHAALSTLSQHTVDYPKLFAILRRFSTSLNAISRASERSKSRTHLPKSLKQPLSDSLGYIKVLETGLTLAHRTHVSMSSCLREIASNRVCESAITMARAANRPHMRDVSPAVQTPVDETRGLVATGVILAVDPEEPSSVCESVQPPPDKINLVGNSAGYHDSHQLQNEYPRVSGPRARSAYTAKVGPLNRRVWIQKRSITGKSVPNQHKTQKTRREKQIVKSLPIN